MVKYGVLFEVRTDFLNIVRRAWASKDLDQGIFVCLPDCWLVVSMHPEGPAVGHLDTGFLGFPLSSSKC
jgi:hypothetical protein